MMNVHERVARAICAASGRNPDAGLVGGYEGPRIPYWTVYSAEATAAIDALATHPVPDELVEAVLRAANLLLLWCPSDAQVEADRLRAALGAALSLPLKTESQVREEYLEELIAEAEGEYVSACKAMDGERMVQASAHIRALRSQTQGEG